MDEQTALLVDQGNLALSFEDSASGEGRGACYGIVGVAAIK